MKICYLSQLINTCHFKSWILFQLEIVRLFFQHLEQYSVSSDELKIFFISLSKNLFFQIFAEICNLQFRELNVTT